MRGSSVETTLRRVRPVHRGMVSDVRCRYGCANCMSSRRFSCPEGVRLSQTLCLCDIGLLVAYVESATG
jgi:hypothetical protein